MQIHDGDATKLCKSAIFPEDAERCTARILCAVICGARIGWRDYAVYLGDDAGMERNRGDVLEGGVV